MENEQNKTTEVKKESVLKKPWMQSIMIMLVIFSALGAFIYWQSNAGKVFIENSLLDAPIVNISASAPGMLNAIYVKEGERISANSQIALVGSEIIYAKEDGIISAAPKALGGYYAPGQTLVSEVVDSHMRVVGSIEENKGLKDIKVGQKATFTVDAFPGKTYEGVVDEISPVSQQTGVVFSISDKRPIQKFNVYVRFDVSQYSELKSGMSAKLTIVTK